MGNRNSTKLLAVQEELPIELPLDGSRVELLRLCVPDEYVGRTIKLDGFFQSNFFVVDLDLSDEDQVLLPYKYELAFQVMAADEALNLTPASPILLDTVSGVQQPVEFTVEHNTSPNFTLSLPFVTGDLILMANVLESQGGVAGAFVNARALNATIF